MNGHDDLKSVESFYLALADKTRLRLLNLMRQGETCVCFFSEVLAESQPKISRHLAYLRGAGLVDTRRDGKWIHYSIRWPSDELQRQVLEATLTWMAGRDEMMADVDRFRQSYSTFGPSDGAHEPRMPFIEQKLAHPQGPLVVGEAVAAAGGVATAYEVVIEDVIPPTQTVAHNELDEFLL